jgi:hypothetical protein
MSNASENSDGQKGVSGQIYPLLIDHFLFAQARILIRTVFRRAMQRIPKEPLCDSTKPKPGNGELINLEVDFLSLQTHLDSIIPLWKVCPLLLLLLCDQLRLMRR